MYDFWHIAVRIVRYSCCWKFVMISVIYELHMYIASKFTLCIYSCISFTYINSLTFHNKPCLPLPSSPPLVSFLVDVLGRLWWTPELPEPRWVLGRPRGGELRLQHGLQLPQEAVCLHPCERLHPLDQQRE